MKRIAVPIVKGKLSEYFGQCSYYEIFEICKGEIKSERIEVIHHPRVNDIPAWASGLGITDVISHKVDRRIIAMFSEYKINLYVGIRVDDPDKLIEDLLSGNLKSDEKILKGIIREKV